MLIIPFRDVFRRSLPLIGAALVLATTGGCGVQTNERVDAEAATSSDSAGRPSSEPTSSEPTSSVPTPGPATASGPPAAEDAGGADATEITDAADTRNGAAAGPLAGAAEASPSGGDNNDARPAESTIATAARPASSADNTDEVVEVVFEDIELPIQEDIVFRPFMLTERTKSLDGRRVRINGYMLPDSKTRGITNFVLLKNTECKFGPGGRADHLINVLMVEGVSTKFRDEPITVEGVFKIKPFQGPDGNTWSIYDLACERVELYQPRR